MILCKFSTVYVFQAGDAFTLGDFLKGVDKGLFANKHLFDARPRNDEVGVRLRDMIPETHLACVDSDPDEV